jgi:predicted enzyme related to lactoylglutathione lyase
MDEKLMRHGAFGWFELMTTDVESAKKFYTELLGWKTEDMPMANLDNMNYTVINVEDDQVAGIMPMPPDAGEMPPAWGIYITVKDVDATGTRAKELGGKIMVEPQDIPEVGRFCVIQDPQGAVFAAITYKQ